MKFIINADTPEEMRTAIVQWLRDQQSNHMRQAFICKRVGFEKEQRHIATAYEAAANFIENIQIEPLRVLKGTTPNQVIVNELINFVPTCYTKPDEDRYE
jgi:hypothetical protein